MFVAFVSFYGFYIFVSFNGTKSFLLQFQYTVLLFGQTKYFKLLSAVGLTIIKNGNIIGSRYFLCFWFGFFFYFHCFLLYLLQTSSAFFDTIFKAQFIFANMLEATPRITWNCYWLWHNWIVPVCHCLLSATIENRPSVNDEETRYKWDTYIERKKPDKALSTITFK